MCIVLLAYRTHPHYDLVVGANRDEFYSRPAAPAAPWLTAPSLVAGQDLEAGGTWLGVTNQGRFAAVTNLRGAQAAIGGSSRGHLVRDFLLATHTPDEFVTHSRSTAQTFAACNLLLADRDALHCWSSGDSNSQALGPGIYAVSNAPLHSTWPKVTRLKAAFTPLAHTRGDELVTRMLDLLRDADVTPGGGQSAALDLGRLEETIFVHTPSYGTRCSSVILRAPSGHLTFVERRYDEHAASVGEQRYHLDPDHSHVT